MNNLTLKHWWNKIELQKMPPWMAEQNNLPIAIFKFY